MAAKLYICLERTSGRDILIPCDFTMVSPLLEALSKARERDQDYNRSTGRYDYSWHEKDWSVTVLFEGDSGIPAPSIEEAVQAAVESAKEGGG